MVNKKKTPTGKEIKNKLKEKRGYPVALAVDLQKVFKLFFGKDNALSMEIAANWGLFAGEAVSYSSPVKITFPKSSSAGQTEGTLYVNVKGGAFASQFACQKLTLIENINRYFGYTLIKDIKVKQTMLKEPLGKKRKTLYKSSMDN